MVKYKNIIKKFKKARILVVGDLVLDQYIKGVVHRISPEAPVPIVLQKEAFYTPGGAANVANNLSSLGVEVTLVGRIGDDIEGQILKKELKKRHIHTHAVFVDKRYDTIFKTRIIAQHQQVVRIDRETVTEPAEDDDFKRSVIGNFLNKYFNDFDGVIISDYGKGMIDRALVAKIGNLSRKKKIPITADPKVEHFKFYGSVTAITPNKKEAEDALKAIPEETRKNLGIQSVNLRSMEDIKRVGKGFLRYLGIESILITLGEQGMFLFEQDKEPFLIPTRAREVFDVSGAGDTVISVFTLALAASASKRQAADIANYAAGVVVGKLGAVAVTQQELEDAIKYHASAGS